MNTSECECQDNVGRITSAGRKVTLCDPIMTSDLLSALQVCIDDDDALYKSTYTLLTYLFTYLFQGVWS